MNIHFLKSACAGCSGAQMTLKAGIERILKEEIRRSKKNIFEKNNG